MEDTIKMQTRDGSLLLEEVSRLFNSYFGEVLNILSSRFPHIRGDKSDNENQFLCLRAKILRCGNDKIREILPAIIENYEVKKVFETQVEVIDIKQRTKNNIG